MYKIPSNTLNCIILQQHLIFIAMDLFNSIHMLISYNTVGVLIGILISSHINVLQRITEYQ